MEETKVGPAVHRLRETRGLTLREVAERSGFSASFLSQVENDQASPSISSMERIAAALGVTLGEFFHTAEQSPAKVIRADDRQALHSGWSNAQMQSLAGGDLSRTLQPVLVTLKPGGRSAKAPYPAPSIEFVFVLTGQIRLTLHSQGHEMCEGDAVTIPKGAMRQWQNVSGKLTRFLIVSAH